MPDGSLDRTALDLLSSCTCQNLRQATRVVTQHYEQALEPIGLKITQLPVLAAAAAMGPIPMSRLADELVMDRTTLTRNLQPLERAGLVKGGAGQRPARPHGERNRQRRGGAGRRAAIVETGPVRHGRGVGPLQMGRPDG